MGQLRQVLQHGRNHSETRLESRTRFRRFHRGALPSPKGAQTPSRSGRQAPARGRRAEDSVVPVQAEQRGRAQDLPPRLPQGAGPPPGLGTQGLCRKERSGTPRRSSTCAIPQRGLQERRSGARVAEPRSLAATRSRSRHLERDARATRGGRGQHALGPWAPAPLRTRRRSGREPHGEASRAGRDKDRNGVPGAVRWHSRPTAPREAGCSGADGEKGRSRSAGSRLRHVPRAASPDRRIWLTERVEATLLCVSLYKAPNNNCLSLHRSLRET